MGNRFLEEASVRLRKSASEAEDALRLIQRYEEESTYVCDAFARLNEESLTCISEIRAAAEQLWKLSERVKSFDVKITPCRLFPDD